VQGNTAKAEEGKGGGDRKENSLGSLIGSFFQCFLCFLDFEGSKIHHFLDFASLE